jgi:hypothetical protein
MAQKFLSIKNFEKYQKTKTKEGTRPWVKLWKSLLGDAEFMKLDPTYRFIYVGLILLADDCDNRIYADSTYLRQRLYMTHTEGIRGTYIGHTQLDLKPLYRSGFLETSNLSRVLSEKRREEERRGEREAAQAPDPPPVVSLPTKEKKRPTPLPADFKFTPELRDWALGKGCKEPFAEFERFCTKAVSKGWVYTDWPKAYQNWVLNELKWAREKSHAAL